MMKQGTEVDRNEVVTLVVLAVITAAALFLPYASLAAYSGESTAFPSPSPVASSVPVYLLSALVQDSEYRGYSTVDSAVSSYGMFFVLMTQVTAVLHILVGLERLRPTKGLFIMGIASSICVAICDLSYGHLQSWWPGQLPLIPLIGTVSMLFYRETVTSDNPTVGIA
jgi:hypothetical protein